MKHSSYFPNRVPERRSWFKNYKTNIATHGPTLGMTAGEITEEGNICDKAISSIDLADAAKLDAKQKNSAQNTTIKNSITDLRKGIRHHKSHADYTKDIGEALGVIGSEIDIDIENVQTKLKANKKFNGVELKFDLKHCEGGNIYSKRKSDTDFRLLKYVTHPHTVDLRPNETPNVPEVREYLVVLCIGDEEVGKPSDVVSIKV